MSDTSRAANQLIHEKSPYLLQHAYNPVQWYPWGEEAFEKAKREDKPVFLSIGYSTCHWCHVMERESFESEEAAGILNEEYVAIKVDREERPDIDAVYMDVCQMLTGSGGWPLTVLLTPDQQPFYAGTYFPLHSVYGRAGLVELLTAVAREWKQNRGKLLHAGERIAAYLQKEAGKKSAGSVDKSLLKEAAGQLRAGFDEVYGGFGEAPKFPSPHQLLFLLRLSELSGEAGPARMAHKTLVQMYRGGIFDHVGGGFSRYSTDRMWLAPHFEKMLYDNAMLIYTYSEAYRLEENPLYERVVKECIRYVLRELRDPAGGFYCAQDADSDGEEGKYYTFTPEEIVDVLGASEAKSFCGRYDITAQGNFEGKSIANLLKTEDYEREYEALGEQKERLFAYRGRRTRLHRDDKILTSWNGMMIAALAKAAAVFEQEEWLAAAKQAWNFVKERLQDKDGGLYVRYREGEAKGAGQLGDYAFMVWALLELYDSSYEAGYLEEALRLASELERLFADEENGGCYLYSGEGEQLIARPKDTYDGAVPSGNSVAGLVFTRLAALTAQERWQRSRDKQLSFIAGEARQYPMASAFGLMAMMEVLYPSQEIVLVSEEQKTPAKVREILKHWNSLKNKFVLVKNAHNAAGLEKEIPFLSAYSITEGRTAVYVCRDARCEPPVFF